MRINERERLMQKLRELQGVIARGGITRLTDSETVRQAADELSQPAAPAAPAPHPLQALTEACEDEQNAIDAERYRWLRDAENRSGPSAGMLEDWKDGGWERVHWYYEDELDAAIDAAIAASRKENL